MKVEILGIPIAKQRARVTRRGNLTWAYDPQQREKLAIIQKLRQFAKECPYFPLQGGIHVGMYFYMPICDSGTRALKNANLWGFGNHQKKPDLSNLVKFYEDCANGVLYRDDSQIVSLESEKIYSAEPRVVIELREIEPLLDSTSQKILSLFSPSEIEQIQSSITSLVSSENLNLLSDSLIALSRYSDRFTKIRKLSDER